jgi:hypothetical protein
VEARHAQLLKLMITGLNALAVHTERSLFCRSIWLHIGTLEGNHDDTIVRI